MTGAYFSFTACHRCGEIFGFNPDLVPAITQNGASYPICRDCAKILNALRVKMGQTPLAISSLAYEPTEHIGPL